MTGLGFDTVRARIVVGLEELVALLHGLDDAAWDRRTRCPGWRVRDAAWHVGWGDVAGEVLRAAREGLDPPEYATARMPPTPKSPDEIVAAAEDELASARADLGALHPDDAGLVVRYGRRDTGQALHEFLWSRLVEVVVHLDDLRTAVGVDEPLAADFAEELVLRRTRAAVAIAAADGLQPVAPRAYRYATTADGGGSGAIASFHCAGGGSWLHGPAPEGVPTTTFSADPTTLARLVMGRIPVTPYDGSWGRPWDDRLRLEGDVAAAPPSDTVRWCSGTW